ncbi:hypothetical protein CRP01_20295 [Flavilitoribacter nigricans DSM 23189 = NBRC 102662]|uniref:Peptidyl-prolyl cis-trans isomerase n=2 Tax=Flavilitoribacter TaxID=2762562 RepID=A0A2D0N949_FLAN2|nr:hypothetical protein CRP01_20295 [Flavilitoribacter nigricans DSM 23189 = NBRC 102662]
MVLLLATGCSSDNEESENRLLARVNNKTLYLADMDGMFPPGTVPEDSALIIDAFTQRWIREAVLLDEAERNIPSDLNIDKLVRDYRASLIKHNYEKILVEELLDSTIAETELQEFYEKNKEQYQLETPIVRCYFLKVPLPVPRQNELRRMWNSKDPDQLKDLVAYCSQFAVAHLLEDSTWYDVEDIAAELPPGTLTANNIDSKREFTQQDDKFQYFFRLFELKNRKDIAPLSYIEDQARKVILHKRKLELLEDTRETMLEREMRRNNVEIYNY